MLQGQSINRTQVSHKQDMLTMLNLCASAVISHIRPRRALLAFDVVLRHLVTAAFDFVVPVATLAKWLVVGCWLLVVG